MTVKDVSNAFPDGSEYTNLNFTYDADDYGYVSQVTVGYLATTYYEHDANGNRTSITDPNSNETQFTYDGLNRLTTVTNPDSSTRSITYDLAGTRRRRPTRTGWRRITPTTC